MKTPGPVLTLAVLTAVAAAACGRDDTTPAGSGSTSTAPAIAIPAGPALNIAFSSPINTNASSIAFEAGLKCYVKKNGGKVTTADAAIQVNKQISDFDTFVTTKPDGIAFAAVDTKALNGPISRAHDAKIPVVEVNNPESAADVAVGEDSFALGKAAADLMAKKLPDGAKALVLKPIYPNPTLDGRYQGFLDAAKANNIEVVGTGGAGSSPDLVSEGQKVGGQLLTAHPDANAVFAFDGSLALGFGQAARSASLDLAIYGIGAGPESIQGLRSGFITAIPDADGFAMGVTAASLIDQVRAGKTPKNAVIGAPVYTKDNADSWVPPDKRCP